ncbi:MAG: iron chaperone [Acholeplasmataceae bacterium]
MRSVPQIFVDYIEKFDEDVKSKFLDIRKIVLKRCPDVVEKMSYGVPTYYHEGILLHVGLFKSHIGIFPGPKTIDHFRSRLESYSLDKGTIRIPYKMDLDVSLIEDIVIYNLEFRK